MSDPEEQQSQSGMPPGGLLLGGLGASEFDSTLRNVGQPPPQADASGPPPDDEPLRLQRGGMVAFRKSGGLRFTSRGVVVTRKGWVQPLSGTPGRRRRITPEALAALEALLLQSGLARLPNAPPATTRDGYSYEIAARVGRKLHHAELGDPVPDEQEPLVRALTNLLPEE